MPADFPIHLFEEHSSTLPIWWQHRASPRVAVYLDAHLDLQQTDTDKIRMLQKCKTLEQVKALEAPHHLNPATRYAFGIENFLYSASKLNLLERLIWVAPPHIPRCYSPALLEYVQQMDGISFEELTSFVATGTSSLRGQLLGLDITICHYDDLVNLDIGSYYYLDIDIDYFVEVPGDRLWIDPGKVVQDIIGQIGSPCVTTISRAVSSGFTPLQFRFVGDYIYVVLQQDHDACGHYQQLYQAARYIDLNELDKALSLCYEAIEYRPDCAASHYLLALASSDVKQAVAMNAHASELDQSYFFEFSREACGYPNRGRSLSHAQLHKLAIKLETLKLDSEQRALAEVAMAQLYAKAGMLEEALHLLNKQIGDLVNHGDLLLAIASKILAGDKPQQARRLLSLVSKHDKNRASATLFLGDLAFCAGDASQALTYYNETHKLAPAWMQPLENQLLCYKVLGETSQVDSTSALISHRKQLIYLLPGMS